MTAKTVQPPTPSDPADSMDSQAPASAWYSAVAAVADQASVLPVAGPPHVSGARREPAPAIAQRIAPPSRRAWMLLRRADHVAAGRIARGSSLVGLLRPRTAAAWQRFVGGRAGRGWPFWMIDDNQILKEEEVLYVEEKKKEEGR